MFDGQVIAGASVSFTVTVKLQAVSYTHLTLPTITCPMPIVQSNDPGQCAAAVSWMPPATSDNCGVDTVFSTAQSGDTFAVGTTTVTYTVEDLSGNADTCSFTVTVNDTEAPTITCPSNITVSNDSGQCAACLLYTSPSPRDS